MDAIFEEVMSQVNSRVKEILQSQLSEFRERILEIAITDSGVDEESAERLEAWFKSVENHRHFGGKSLAKKEKPKSPKVVLTADTDLNNLTVQQLKELLKDRGLTVSGTKAMLVERLSAKEVKPKPKSKEFVSSASEDDEPKREIEKKTRPKKVLKEISDSETEAVPVKRLTKSKKPKGTADDKPKKPAKKTVPIVEKVIEEAPEYILIKDEHNRIVHMETGLVFDEEREAIGTVGPDGKTLPLTKKAMEMCKKMGVLYEIPENIDSDSD